MAMWPMTLNEADRPQPVYPESLVASQDISQHVHHSDVYRLLYDHSQGSTDDHFNIFYLVVFIASFVFNFVLTCLFIVFEGVRAVQSNHFIAALAVSNVLVSVHLIIFNVILDPMIGPNALCDFAVYAGVIFCASSNLSRCAIAIDRYIFISDPLRYYQRTQCNCRAFGVGSVFVLCVAIIVTPYVFSARQGLSEQSCLPTHPKVYVGCVTILLAVAPGILLIIIYTRIFYWAFLQMQILRQEAKKFLHKNDHLQAEQINSAHSSVTSRQLRLYTGAAILLTPTSPFSSHKHSLEISGSPEIGTADVQTTIRKIIHVLSGLRETRNHSGRSTCVDNNRDSGSSRNPEDSSRSAATTSGHGGMARLGVPSHFSHRAEFATNTNRNARSKEPSLTNSLYSSLSARGRNFAGSPIDHLYTWGRPTMGPNSSSHLGLHMAPSRDYIPVTPQGKWMEQRLKQLEVEVVRSSTVSAPDVADNLMCNLLKAELKAAVMIMALMGAFVVCWMPFVIVQILTIFDLDRASYSERRVVVLLVVVNCALDPFTYALMNPPFRAVVNRSLDALCRPYRRRNVETVQQPTKKMAFRIKRKQVVDEYFSDVVF